MIVKMYYIIVILICQAVLKNRRIKLVLIKAKMAQLGIENMSAYLRKMAIDGYDEKLDMPELREPKNP
jgi:hypothetical protein